MYQAVISPLGIHRSGFSTGFGKLPSIWFDKIILPGNLNWIENLVDRLCNQNSLSPKVADELLNAWSPITSVSPEYYNVTKDNWDNLSEYTSEIIWKIATEAIREENLGCETAPSYDVAMRGNYILGSIATWTSLNITAPCSFLSEKFESKAIQEILDTVARILRSI
jgi:hypothetical protein